MSALEGEGPLAVRARRIAASAGTSTAALYEFFGDKTGLVRAIYFEGFAALRAALEAVPPHASPRDHLLDLLAASRSFALERPMLFDVMYSRPFAEFSPDERDAEAGAAIYRLTVAAVRRWLKDARSSTSATEAAHMIVAAHRGFVVTELAGLAGNSSATIEARYHRSVDAILTGVASVQAGAR